MPPRAEFLRAAIAGSAASLCGRHQTVRLSDMGRALEAGLSGRNVLLRSSDQLFAALGLIELDGVAARIVIAPPDIKPEHLAAIVERAGIETVVSDDPALAVEGVNFAQLHLPRSSQARLPPPPRGGGGGGGGGGAGALGGGGGGGRGSQKKKGGRGGGVQNRMDSFYL